MKCLVQQLNDGTTLSEYDSFVVLTKHETRTGFNIFPVKILSARHLQTWSFHIGHSSNHEFVTRVKWTHKPYVYMWISWPRQHGTCVLEPVLSKDDGLVWSQLCPAMDCPGCRQAFSTLPISFGCQHRVSCFEMNGGKVDWRKSIVVASVNVEEGQRKVEGIKPILLRVFLQKGVCGQFSVRGLNHEPKAWITSSLLVLTRLEILLEWKSWKS